MYHFVRIFSCSGPFHGLRDIFQEQKTIDTPSKCLIVQGLALDKAC